MLDIIEDAYTFDDVLLVPSYSEVLPKDVSLKTQLTKNLSLNIPILSAAMDTVTDSKMAIAMAQEGGIGIIHKNMSKDIQAKRVKIVKRHESGIVKEPVTISSDKTLKDLLELTYKSKISGVPVVDNGELIGIVTNRDIRFEINFNIQIKDIMTKKDKLITILEGDPIDKAKALMYKNRIERILVVDKKFRLKGLITAKDLTKNIIYPNANKDNLGQLRVGAAIGIDNYTLDRVELLVDANVDVLVVDTAHAHSKKVLDIIRYIKVKYPQVELVAGNIVTVDAALDLINVGADAIKVGIGPGSICTTRIIAGVGIPQLSAIHNIATSIKDKNIPIIADGGIRFSGDIAKSIAAGASCVMLGSLLAGTDESPGDIELYQGRSYKTYRGMGSVSAMSLGSSDRYFQDNINLEQKLVPEGVEGRVPYRGSLSSVLDQLLGGLRASMGYTGSENILQMQQKTKFVRITNAGIKESHVHDVQITKETSNYSSNNILN